MSYIEEESEDSYTIRTDILEEGQAVVCRDDKDMVVKKSGNSVILVKKCFKKDCFS